MGGVINQDHNLAQILTSDSSIDVSRLLYQALVFAYSWQFFLDRYRSSDNDALSRLKAHV